MSTFLTLKHNSYWFNDPDYPEQWRVYPDTYEEDDTDYCAEARRYYTKESALEFISDKDLWEELSFEVGREKYRDLWEAEERDGIEDLALSGAIDQIIFDVVCGNEDMAKEFYRWMWR